jgi:hypothetical protein
MDIPRPTVSKWLQEKTKSKSVLMATTLHILPLAKVLTRKSLAGFRVSTSWVGWTKPEGELGYDRNGAFRGEGQTV